MIEQISDNQNAESVGPDEGTLLEIAEKIGELEGEEQLRYGMSLINMGLNDAVAANLDKFNGSNREVISNYLIDVWKKKEGK